VPPTKRRFYLCPKCCFGAPNFWNWDTPKMSVSSDRNFGLLKMKWNFTLIAIPTNARTSGEKGSYGHLTRRKTKLNDWTFWLDAFDQKSVKDRSELSEVQSSFWLVQSVGFLLLWYTL
jgi:hypothetical protein